MASAWLSKAHTPRYSAASSKITRTSVRSLAGWPSEGSRWVKPVMTGACCQTASSRRPSMLGPSVTSVAVAVAGMTPPEPPLAEAG